MPKRDPHIDAHLEWIGFVRPTGLVVSAPALVRAGAILPRDPEGQGRLRACVAERRFHPDRESGPWLPDFQAFASTVLGWNFSPKGYAGTDGSPIPPELETPLQEGGEVLRPDFAVRERDPREDASPWQLLVKMIEPGEDFDRVAGGAGRLEVSAHGRMERLLRQTGVPAGLLSNGRSLRIVLRPARRELRLARPARGRHGHHVRGARRRRAGRSTSTTPRVLTEAAARAACRRFRVGTCSGREALRPPSSRGGRRRSTPVQRRIGVRQRFPTRRDRDGFERAAPPCTTGFSLNPNTEHSRPNGLRAARPRGCGLCGRTRILAGPVRVSR